MSKPYRETTKTELNIAKNCYNFEQQHFKTDYLEQYRLFSETPEFLKVINSLRNRLGMKSNLTASEVYLINEWCAYGTYISDDMTWCNLLSDEDRDILEYGQDILDLHRQLISCFQNYYKYSYGQSVNGRMMCPLVKNIFNTMDSTLNRSFNYFKDTDSYSFTKAKFYFVNDDTFIPLLTALGLFKDSEPLLANSMKKMQDRKFRTSQISSFGSSLSLLIYVCDNSRRLALDEFSPGQQDYLIQAFINENRVPFCTNKYYCSYKTTRNSYSEFMERCNLTDVCGTEPLLVNTSDHGSELVKDIDKFTHIDTRLGDNEGSAGKAEVADKDMKLDDRNENVNNDNKGSGHSLLAPCDTSLLTLTFLISIIFKLLTYY